MTTKGKARLVRKNTQVPKYVAEWLESRSEETGLSQSSIMLLAITQYMDQQKSLEMSGTFNEMKEFMKEVSEQKGEK